MLVGAIFRPVHAAGTGDLMSSVPVVDENTLNNAACGIAAATMILDYYTGRTIDIKAVAQYVEENYLGTNTDQLQTGLETASTAPALHIGIPLAAFWHTTDNSHWFSVLQTELDARKPIVLYLADGGTLGWNWHYPHFIVVSGYTDDDSIIYHDPWDGIPHTLSNAAFDRAWSSTWNGNPSWWYMQITTSQTPTPPTSTTASVPTPTQPLSPTPSPSPSATSTTTLTPPPTPTATSLPPTLSVSPSSRVNDFQGCSTETHGGSGVLLSCPFVLSNSIQTTSILNWSVSASNPRVTFDHSSGTLAPGQSTNIAAIMYGNGNGGLPCPFTMTLLFKGSPNTIQVPLMCTEIYTNPDGISFDNTYCSHNGNWVCVINVVADSQNAMNTPWVATVQMPDPKVIFSPAQGTLAPGATVQVTITILNSDCPGNNTFFFYVPGSLPIGGNYLGWSC